MKPILKRETLFICDLSVESDFLELASDFLLRKLDDAYYERRGSSVVTL
jgi:hypothetical protein